VARARARVENSYLLELPRSVSNVRSHGGKRQSDASMIEEEKANMWLIEW
jgi:hypothetical protein